MKSVRCVYPQEWPNANVYVLADLHLGDPRADQSEIERRISEVRDDPRGLCVLGGDLLNTATRNSVSDVYGERLSPMQQIIAISDLIRPIADKVIGATTGNHEARVYRDDGVDIMRLVCRELGLEDRYDPDGVVIFLRFGHYSHGSHTERDNRLWYTFYVAHGSGSGRKEGAKAIRLADMASICEADVYIHAHTHLPLVMKNAFYRTDERNCCVRRAERLFVNCGATLDYGGYAQRGEFKPASMHTPIIHLGGNRKIATATL